MESYYTPIDGTLKLYMMRASNVYLGMRRLFVYKSNCSWEELNVEREEDYQARIQGLKDGAIILVPSQNEFLKSLREINEEEAQEILIEIEQDDGYYLQSGICCYFA